MWMCANVFVCKVRVRMCLNVRAVQLWKLKILQLQILNIDMSNKREWMKNNMNIKNKKKKKKNMNKKKKERLTNRYYN